jgi:hypothetical protein
MNAGITDDDIESAESVDGGLDSSLDSLALGHISGQWKRGVRRTQRVRRGVNARTVLIDQRDARARIDEMRRAGLANPLRGAGHENGLASERHERPQTGKSSAADVFIIACRRAPR